MKSHFEKIYPVLSVKFLVIQSHFHTLVQLYAIYRLHLHFLHWSILYSKCTCVINMGPINLLKFPAPLAILIVYMCIYSCLPVFQVVHKLWTESFYDACIVNGPLARYVKLRVAHAPGMPGTFSPPPPVSDPDMHPGTCVTHVPWCMPGSLSSVFLRSWWRGKRSRNSRRMRNTQF